jgi:methionyl-tRNA formyltransferase
LPSYLEGAAPLRPQGSDGVTVTGRLTRQDARLDPKRSAAELERQVRAHRGWPGSFIETTEGRLGVADTLTEAEAAGDVPGTLVEAAHGLPAIATAGGRLVLLRVQPAGSREMLGADFLRGHRDLIGTKLAGAATVSGR